MRSKVEYLISAVSNMGATGTVPVVGMDRFTVSMQGQAFGNSPATGKVDIQARVDENTPFVNIYSLTFGGNSGVLFNYEYPIESLRAVLNDGTPSPTGTFTVAARFGSLNP